MFIKLLLPFVLALFCSSYSIGQGNVSEIDTFLKEHAVMVDSNELAQNIRQFLFFQMIEGSPVWNEGSLLLDSGRELRGVILKFNIFNNSVYVKKSNRYFKVSNIVIEGFNIKSTVGTMNFMKGFGLPYSGIVELKTSLRHQEILTYLNEYQGLENLNIRNLTIEKVNEGCEISIGMETGFREPIFELKKYMLNHKDISIVNAEYQIPDLNENTYMEVLYNNESFIILKHHFKKIAQIESVSLNQHKSVFMFDEKDYFMGNSENILIEFLFTKKSIRNAFTASDVVDFPKLKKVGNEEKLLTWLRQNFNN